MATHSVVRKDLRGMKEVEDFRWADLLLVSDDLTHRFARRRERNMGTC
jgi:hypothetical protein